VADNSMWSHMACRLP